MSKFDKSTKRQELNKLSEIKVIKQCKKHNVNIYKLSKREMIDKLVKKLEAKHNFKKSQFSKSMPELTINSIFDKYAVIVHGFAK